MALSIGLLGSIHCVGMCGGIVAALSMGKKGPLWQAITLYHAGRILTYSLAGLVVGIIGLVVTENQVIDNARQILSIVAGIFMIVFALQIGGMVPERFLNFSLIKIPASLLRKTSEGGSIYLWGVTGLVNGLLPCGMVYAALSLSLMQAEPVKGMLIMTSFGIGTVPAMTGMAMLIRRWAPSSRGVFLRWTALALVIFGFMTMARGYLVSNDHIHHLPFSQVVDIDGATCDIKDER